MCTRIFDSSDSGPEGYRSACAMFGAIPSEPPGSAARPRTCREGRHERVPEIPVWQFSGLDFRIRRHTSTVSHPCVLIRPVRELPLSFTSSWLSRHSGEVLWLPQAARTDDSYTRTPSRSSARRKIPPSSFSIGGHNFRNRLRTLLESVTLRPGSGLQTVFHCLYSKLNEIVPYQEMRSIALDANAGWDPAGTVFQVKNRLRLEVGVFRGA
jgi:hypothetical protein